MVIGGAVVLGEGRDIVTGETCVPVSLNVNNLGEAAVLHYPFLWPGLCQSQPKINILGKAAELHLAVLMSSFHRFLISCSPRNTRRWHLLLFAAVCCHCSLLLEAKDCNHCQVLGPLVAKTQSDKSPT
jgi:hypothetical protein